MAIEQVRRHLSRWGRDGDIIEFAVSMATVAEAAQALGVVPARIAKTLSLRNGGGAMLVVIAGDMKLDNHKFKDRFGFKAKMLSPEDALRFTGHAVGGICPFGLPPGTKVYLDVSLRRFETVFPACGSANSAIELTPERFQEYSPCNGWVDVCRPIAGETTGGE